MHKKVKHPKRKNFFCKLKETSEDAKHHPTGTYKSHSYYSLFSDAYYSNLSLSSTNYFYYTKVLLSERILNAQNTSHILKRK